MRLVGGLPWRTGSLLAALLLLAAIEPAAVHANASGFTFVADSTPTILPPGSRLVGAADVTGSGVADLLLIDAESNEVGVMLGSTSGAFAPPAWLALEGHASEVRVADFNGDGHPDLLVPLESVPPVTKNLNWLPDKVEILFGDGSGGFTAGPTVKLPEVGPVYVGNFSGTARPEVVVAPGSCAGANDQYTYYTMLDDSSGQLTPGPTYTAPVLGGCDAFVGDVNGDGRDDLVTESTGPGGEPMLVDLPGETDGGLGPAVISPSSGGFVAALGDINDDGKLDAISRVPRSPEGEVATYDGTGSGAFTPAGAYPSDGGRFSFVLLTGDFDGTGRLVMITLGSKLAAITNSPTGALSPILEEPWEAGYENVVADVNGDGRPDLILGSPTWIQVLLDEPVAQPTPPTPIASPVAPSIEAASESARVWREGRQLARVSSAQAMRRPLGTIFKVALNESATVRFSFRRSVPGHLSIHGCRAGRLAGRTGKRCEALASEGMLSLVGHAGVNQIAFQGRISRSHELKAGTYTAVITASNAGGSSKSVTLSFTVVHGRR